MQRTNPKLRIRTRRHYQYLELRVEAPPHSNRAEELESDALLLAEQCTRHVELAAKNTMWQLYIGTNKSPRWLKLQCYFDGLND